MKLKITLLIEEDLLVNSAQSAIAITVKKQNQHISGFTNKGVQNLEQIQI